MLSSEFVSFQITVIKYSLMDKKDNLLQEEMKFKEVDHLRARVTNELQRLYADYILTQTLAEKYEDAAVLLESIEIYTALLSDLSQLQISVHLLCLQRIGFYLPYEMPLANGHYSPRIFLYFFAALLVGFVLNELYVIVAVRLSLPSSSYRLYYSLVFMLSLTYPRSLFLSHEALDRCVFLWSEHILLVFGMAVIPLVIPRLVQAFCINIQDKRYGDTALMRASDSGGHTATVESLIAKGADLNIKNIRGDTALTLALSEGHTAIAESLIAKGADLNNILKYGGDTALTWASRNGRTAIAESLIAKGADINIKNNNGDTALTLASKNGHTATAESLIAKGAR